MAPLLKLLCTFVLALLVVMSAGDHSGALAARPVPLDSTDTDTEAPLGERGGRRLEVSPWPTTRKAAQKISESKNTAGPSHRSNSPGNPN
jgi:hypothetical protein